MLSGQTKTVPMSERPVFSSECDGIGNGGVLEADSLEGKKQP